MLSVCSGAFTFAAGLLDGRPCTTHHAGITRQRVQHAERLLEQTDEPIERIASLSGFGSATLLRHHFVKQRRTTPQAYRRTFRRTSRLGA